MCLMLQATVDKGHSVGSTSVWNVKRYLKRAKGTEKLRQKCVRNVSKNTFIFPLRSYFEVTFIFLE